MAGGESSGSTAVNIDELAYLMAKEINYYLALAEMHNNRKSSCTIPKISKHISKLDRSAYEPSILSIGPYHHGKPNLQAFEKKKWNCLNYILHMNYNVQLHDYLKKIAELETQARNCYLDGMKMDDSKFLQMLLLDGCFILVHLHGIDGIERSWIDEGNSSEKKCMCNIIEHERQHTCEARGFEEIKDEHIMEYASTSMEQLESSVPGLKAKCLMHMDSVELSQISQEKVPEKLRGHYQDGKWYYSCASHDILILENQIPFFVVKTIYKLAADTEDFNRLTDNIVKFIEGILYVYPKAIQETDRPKNFHHLLHLCHMYFSPSQQRADRQSELFQGLRGFGCRYFNVGHLKKEKKEDMIFHNHLNSHRGYRLNRWRHAVQYHESGIEFKRREFNEDNPHSLLDIKFHGGVIEIPFLLIDQMTGPLFRNFIALEQASPDFGNDFTAYAAFISQLMDSANDVSFLVKRGILVHQMRSDEEVSVFVNQLGKNVDFDLNGSHYLRSICVSMEEHYQNRLNRWMAWLWQTHFRNPWLSLAVLAAIIVLACTVLQSLFALLAYVKPVAENSSPNVDNTMTPVSRIH